VLLREHPFPQIHLLPLVARYWARPKRVKSRRLGGSAAALRDKRACLPATPAGGAAPSAQFQSTPQCSTSQAELVLQPEIRSDKRQEPRGA
jgi:hypothetical protein